MAQQSQMMGMGLGHESKQACTLDADDAAYDSGSFGYIAAKVVQGDAAGFDATILFYFRSVNDVSDPVGPPWLEEVARDISALGLKLIFQRPRPDIVEHATRVFTTSFPSGHATLSAIAYLTLGALLANLHTSLQNKIYFLIAILVTIGVGVSRIYLGVRYPTDVLAGWCIGAAWAGLWWTLFTRLHEGRRIERPI